MKLLQVSLGVVFGLMLAVFGLSRGASADVRTTLVTELPMLEVYMGHLLHDGLLWESVSRQADGEKNRVDIFDAKTLARVGSVSLTFMPDGIYPMTDHQVMVIGRDIASYTSNATVITHAGSDFSAKHSVLSEDYVFNEFAGRPGSMFFGEMGEASIYQIKGPSIFTPVLTPVSGPGHMELEGNDLWIIEMRSFDPGDENVIKFNTVTGVADRTFKDFYRLGLFELKVATGTPYVAFSETLADQVLLIDKASNKLVKVVPVKGDPRGIAQFGGCLAVVSEATKQVSFISLANDPAVIETWDLSGAGDRLKMPEQIQVDAINHRVLVRSTYLCKGCSVTQSSVFAAEDPDSRVFETCLAK